jgi:Transposase IS116/IS110/IS902 family
LVAVYGMGLRIAMDQQDARATPCVTEEDLCVRSLDASGREAREHVASSSPLELGRRPLGRGKPGLAGFP